MIIKKDQEAELLAQAKEKFISESAHFMREEFNPDWLKTKGANLEDFLRKNLAEATALGLNTKLSQLKYLIVCVTMDNTDKSHLTAHEQFKSTVRSLSVAKDKEDLLNLYQQVYAQGVTDKLKSS